MKTSQRIDRLKSGLSRTLTVILVASIIFIGISASEAFAYSYDECGDKKVRWGSNSNTLHASSTSFPSGYWEDGIRETIERFNNNVSNFRYDVEMDDGGTGLSNFESEIWGTTDSDLHNDGPAVAYSMYTCFWLGGWHSSFTEVDIVFNYESPFRWTADESKDSLMRYNGSKRSLQTTGAHELGHGLILNHVNSEYNIMGLDFEHIHVNGSTARAYPGEDAGDGAAFLYGERSGWEDVGVVHWKYSGASGEYSNHTKTVVYNSAGNELGTTDVDGERGYRVSPGEWVQVEFTYENNGASYQSGVEVGYFVSTNDYISTWDERIGGRTFNLSRDDVHTATSWVKIPNDLSSNTDYWLGAVIDENDVISEEVEWNNATYIPIHVE